MRRLPTAPSELIDRVRAELQRDGQLTLRVRVRAGRNETRVATSALGDADFVLDVAAPADENRANFEVQRFLAELACVPRTHVELVIGRTNPRKVFRITRA